MADRPHRPVTSVMMGNHPTLPDESQRNIPTDPRGRDIQRQMFLAKLLRDMGDTRYGGSLPLGGKPYGGWQRRGAPEMFLTVPAMGTAAEGQAYDHEMNVYESELEDLKRRK